MTISLREKILNPLLQDSSLYYRQRIRTSDMYQIIIPLKTNFNILIIIGGENILRNGDMTYRAYTTYIRQI